MNASDWNASYDFWQDSRIVSTRLMTVIQHAQDWELSPTDLLGLQFVPTGGDYSWSQFKVA
jgi:hypothetical protein